MADSEPTTSRKDPLPAFCFKVTITIDGCRQGEAFFKSVSGLSMETEVVDYRAGGVNHSTYKLVGATKWKNIVLKRGFTASTELLAWRKAWLNPGAPNNGRTRADITIEQLDTQLQTKATWEFGDGWPCKWDLSELDAAKNEVAIETLEIAHHGLKSFG
jgi:phage tail-like protein